MWLVIGYGNLLCRDDGFGCVVAERLKEVLPDSAYAELEILSASQLRPEWAEAVSRACAVIFVDASANLSPGQLSCLPLMATNALSPAMNSFSHQLTPEILLGLARILYDRSPPAWIFLAGAEDFSLGESLSDRVNGLVPQTLALIKEKILSAHESTNACQTNPAARQES